MAREASRRPQLALETALLALVLLSCSTTSALKVTSNEESRLMKALFDGYSKEVRPVPKWSDDVQVNVNIDLVKVASVIEDHQTVTLYVRMQMFWKDANFNWQPSNYSGLSSVVVPAERVWIPDVHLLNSAIDDDLIYPVNVEIFSNGTVQTYPITHLYAYCEFDFTRFPYDTQECEFLIGSLYDNTKVKLKINSVSSSNVAPNQEWKLVDFTETSGWTMSVPGVGTREQFGNNWSIKRLLLRIKRSPSFYVNLFIWPLLFILTIASGLFILPPSCVERASLGVLLILTLVIMTLMLETYTPKTSMGSSVIGRLLGFSMFMITWSTVFSTLIISIDKDSFVHRNIPIWLKRLMLNYIAKAVCKYNTLHAALTATRLRDEDIDVIDTSQMARNRMDQMQANANASEENNEAAAVDGANRDLINTSQQPAAATTTTASTASSSNQITKSDLNQAQTLLVLISNQLALMRRRFQDKDVRAQNQQEWYLIALTLDRFCLLVYTVITSLGLISIFI